MGHETLHYPDVLELETGGVIKLEHVIRYIVERILYELLYAALAVTPDEASPEVLVQFHLASRPERNLRALVAGDGERGFLHSLHPAGSDHRMLGKQLTHIGGRGEECHVGACFHHTEDRLLGEPCVILAADYSLLFRHGVRLEFREEVERIFYCSLAATVKPYYSSGNGVQSKRALCHAETSQLCLLADDLYTFAYSRDNVGEMLEGNALTISGEVSYEDIAVVLQGKERHALLVSCPVAADSLSGPGPETGEVVKHNLALHAFAVFRRSLNDVEEECIETFPVILNDGLHHLVPLVSEASVLGQGPCEPAPPVQGNRTLLTLQV